MKSRLLRGLSLTSLVVGLTWYFSLTSSPSYSQSGQAGMPGVSISSVAPAHVASSGSSMMASSILSNGYQQIAIFDQARQTMAVYHIEPSTGDIQLKSVRRLDADLALQEFNLSEPTPSTIRKNVR